MIYLEWEIVTHLVNFKKINFKIAEHVFIFTLK
jgi:hypothetical protein